MHPDEYYDIYDEHNNKFTPGPKIWYMQRSHFPPPPPYLSTPTMIQQLLSAQDGIIHHNHRVLHIWLDHALEFAKDTIEARFVAHKAECQKILATATGPSIAVWSNIGLYDLYDTFVPGPKTWRMAPHHFDPIPAIEDTEEYAILLEPSK